LFLEGGMFEPANPNLDSDPDEPLSRVYDRSGRSWHGSESDDPFRPSTESGLADLGIAAKRVGIGVAALAGIALAVWLTTRLLTGAILGDGTIYLTGPNVEHLSENARVVVGKRVIGSVTNIGLRDGQYAATLSIERAAMRELSSDAEFEVASLNDWMPGNIGVRIRPNSANAAERLANGDRMIAKSSVLPPVIPQKFWLVVAGCALIVVLMAVAAKALQTVIGFARIIHGFIAAAVGIIWLLAWLEGRVTG